MRRTKYRFKITTDSQYKQLEVIFKPKKDPAAYERHMAAIEAARLARCTGTLKVTGKIKRKFRHSLCDARFRERHRKTIPCVIKSGLEYIPSIRINKAELRKNLNLLKKKQAKTIREEAEAAWAKLTSGNTTN